MADTTDQSNHARREGSSVGIHGHIRLGLRRPVSASGVCSHVVFGYVATSHPPIAARFTEDELRTQRTGLTSTNRGVRILHLGRGRSRRHCCVGHRVCDVSDAAGRWLYRLARLPSPPPTPPHPLPSSSARVSWPTSGQLSSPWHAGLENQEYTTVKHGVKPVTGRNGLEIMGMDGGRSSRGFDGRMV